MAKRRNPQEYSAKEFDQVVKLIERDADLRADIEAITGQKLTGKSPREQFDLYRTLDAAAELAGVVVRYGQARRAVRRTRIDLADPEQLPPPIADYVAELQAKVTEERKKRQVAEEALKAARSRNVVSLPAAGQKAVNG